MHEKRACFAELSLPVHPHHSARCCEAPLPEQGYIPNHDCLGPNHGCLGLTLERQEGRSGGVGSMSCVLCSNRLSSLPSWLEKPSTDILVNASSCIGLSVTTMRT